MGCCGIQTDDSANGGGAAESFTAEFLGTLNTTSGTFATAVTAAPSVVAGEMYAIWLDNGFQATSALDNLEIGLDIIDPGPIAVERRDQEIVSTADLSEPFGLMAFHVYNGSGAITHNFVYRRKAGSGTVSLKNPRMCGIRVA